MSKNFDYEANGAGPTIVLVPGSCSTGAAWRQVVAAWNGTFRCVTTSLLGYGKTEERRPADDPGMAHEVSLIEDVVCRAGGPVHLVGHSFGGLVALAVALRDRVPLTSLCIMEAPAVSLLEETGEQIHKLSFRRMKERYFAEFDAGNPEAIAIMIDFYGGPGTFASWPQRVRDYAIATTAVNVRDWATAYQFPLAVAALQRVEVPTLVIHGANSVAAMQRANELLSQHIPAAAFASIEGAAHFMISTHPEEVSRLVGAHVARAEARARSALSGSRSLLEQR